MRRRAWSARCLAPRPRRYFVFGILELSPIAGGPDYAVSGFAVPTRVRPRAGERLIPIGARYAVEKK